MAKNPVLLNRLIIFVQAPSKWPRWCLPDTPFLTKRSVRVFNAIANNTKTNFLAVFVTPDQGNVDGTGLIGLGPSSGSNILSTLNSAAGNTPLDSIFLLDLTTPNFLSILLGRADEPGAPFPGDITVGEILPGYENVTSQPQLNVTEVSLSEAGNQHWQALLDADGCIGPDGHPIPVSTVVEGAPNPDQLTAVFDSGFSLPQVPKYASVAHLLNSMLIIIMTAGV